MYLVGPCNQFSVARWESAVFFTLFLPLVNTFQIFRHARHLSRLPPGDGRCVTGISAASVSKVSRQHETRKTRSRNLTAVHDMPSFHVLALPCFRTRSVRTTMENTTLIDSPVLTRVHRRASAVPSFLPPRAAPPQTCFEIPLCPNRVSLQPQEWATASQHLVQKGVRLETR
jgi:hypothetical protein